MPKHVQYNKNAPKHAEACLVDIILQQVEPMRPTTSNAICGQEELNKALIKEIHLNVTFFQEFMSSKGIYLNRWCI